MNIEIRNMIYCMNHLNIFIAVFRLHSHNNVCNSSK